MAQHVLSVEDMVGAVRQWKRDPTGCRDPAIGEIVGALYPPPSVVARDLSVAEALDIAHRLVEEKRLGLFVKIVDCFFVRALRKRAWWLRDDGSLDWGQISYDLEWCDLVHYVAEPFGDMARFEAIVCVALVALSPADSAVLMIKESSICPLACALVALTARDECLCKWRLPLAPLARRGWTEKEVEAFWTALAFNRTLTSLDLLGEPWYCSTAAGGVRHLSMLRSNSTLETLRVFENRRFSQIESDDWGNMNGGVANGGSAGLKYLSLHGLKYDLDVDELLQMLAHLGALEQLHLTVKLSRRTGTGTTGHDLEGMPMPRASSVKRVHLGCVGPHEPHLLRCLSANGTLETLRVAKEVWDREGYEALFRLLTPPIATATATAPTTVIDGQPLPALSLIKSLQHLYTRREPNDPTGIFPQYVPSTVVHVQQLSREVDALAGMIVANNILLTLNLRGSCYSAEQWAGHIMPALALNSTLQTLNLSDCRGVDADGVYDAMLSMLQVNTSLKKITLSGTPLKIGGKAKAIEAKLKRNKEYRAALAGLPTMPVKSCRLVLCGYPLAGKTTLCETMLTGVDTTNVGHPTREQVQASRTRGFEVKLLLNEPDMRISLWDFAGQKQYYALHDFVFPAVNSSSLFLFVYSPVRHCHDPANPTNRFQYKSSAQFRDEFTYWLKFVASNARSGPDQPAKPAVLIAITFFDELLRQELSSRCRLEVYEVVEQLQQQFAHVIHVLPEPFFLDARSRTAVDTLSYYVGQHLRDLVNKLPEVPTICEHIRRALETWSVKNQGKPIMKVLEFQQLCQTVCEAVRESPDISEEHRTYLQEFLATGDSWKVVASYLKDTGELIYFRDMDFIVVSPHWLGRGVLGQVIDMFGFGDGFQDIPRFDTGKRGFLTKKNLERLLQASLCKVDLQQDLITVENLIHLMLKFHLCYEDRSLQNVVVGYFLPVLFNIQQENPQQQPQGQIQLQWPSQTEDTNDHFFAGLRLQCGDFTCTFLTPGFFPRLQVMLYNYFLEKGWIPLKHECCVKVDVDIFGIATHGLDILVECSGSIGFYVDILARSVIHPTQCMNFLHEHVVKPIRSLCASDEGCMGVALVEGVVRQECVKLRTLCRYRKDESALTEMLLHQVRASHQGGSEYYHHQWSAVADEEAGKPPVLSARIECATVLDGHVILGQKHEIERAIVLGTQEVREECYPDSNVKKGKKRGLAVLISMEKYESGDRSGGSVDRGRLEALADSLCLNLHGNLYLDFLADDVRKAMVSTAETRISAEDECFVCFVNAHGGTANDGAQFFTDSKEDKVYLLNDIVEPFRKCKNLFGKPKIFFINACRGTLKLGSADGSGGEQHIPLQWSEGLEARYVYQHSDCLIVFSTSEQAVSMRDDEYGTNFVHALMETFNNKRNTIDVLSIITLVTYNVVNVEEEEIDVSGHVKTISQCPFLLSSLRKKVYWRSG